VHKACSLEILSNAQEMGIAGPEGIPDIRDGIELYGFLSPFTMFVRFLKDLFINQRFEQTKRRLRFILLLADLAAIVNVRTSLGGWDRMLVRRLCSMILI